MKPILIAGCGLLLMGGLQAQDKLGVQTPDAVEPVTLTEEVASPDPVGDSTVEVEREFPPRVPSRIPPRGEKTSLLDSTTTSDGAGPDTWDLMTVGGILLFGIGLAIWLKLRKRGGFMPSGGRLMRMVASLDIPGGRVSLVEVGETLYLVGSTEGGGLACLDRVVDPVVRARWLADLKPTRVAAGADESFQDEYSSMIERMSQGTPRTAEPAPEATTERLADELDGLKQRLREIV